MKKVTFATLAVIFVTAMQSFAQIIKTPSAGEWWFISTTGDTTKVKLTSDGHFLFYGTSTQPIVLVPDTLTTAERDALTPRNGAYIYNSDDDQAQVYAGGAWADITAGAGSGAPTNATYITQTPNGTLSAEQALNALTDGLLKHTSGVVARAIPGTDYVATETGDIEGVTAGDGLGGGGTSGAVTVTANVHPDSAIAISGDSLALRVDNSTINIASNKVQVKDGGIGATQIASTSVTPGSYTNTNLTVDADGRITAASNGSGGSGWDSSAVYAQIDTLKQFNNDTTTISNEVKIDSGLAVVGNITVTGTVDGKDIATNAGMLNEAETIGANWVNTANPWAENELVSTVLVESDQNAGTDITADLEEETHASEHEDTGADEIAITAGMMNAGTGASSATFWRGDNTWATPAGSGDVSKVGTPVDNQIGVWTGDGTIEGNAEFIWVADTSLVISSDADSFFVRLYRSLYPLDLEIGNTRMFAVDSAGNVVVNGTVDGVDIAARDHDAVTLTAGADALLSLTGQQIDLDGTLIVARGGTGASTLTDGGVLLGSGTGAITAMGVLTDGEFIVGDGTTDPVAESGRTARISMGVDIPSLTQDTPVAADSLAFWDVDGNDYNRTAFSVLQGSVFQAWDTDLDTWAGITPGTGVGTALAVNVGSAGAFVVLGGALGTPSSGTGTNLTGIPLSGVIGGTAGANAYDFGGATSLEIPNGTNPTVDAAGEIAYDTDENGIRVYDGTNDRLIPSTIFETKTILYPDSVRARSDDVGVWHFPAEQAPFGVTIVYVAISTSASASDTHVIEEWDDPIGTTQATVHSLTLSTATKAETSSPTDGAIAADAYLNINLDDATDNLNWLAITFGYYINPGD